MFPCPCALMFSPSLLAPQGDYKVIGDLEERNDRQVDPLLSLFLFLCVSSFSPLFCLMKSYKKSFSIDHRCSSTSEGDLASVISFLVCKETKMSVT